MSWSAIRKISEKTNYPILRKLSDGQTGGRTDGQTDENDFIGRCPTNVERPKGESKKKVWEKKMWKKQKETASREQRKKIKPKHLKKAGTKAGVAMHKK